MLVLHEAADSLLADHASIEVCALGGPLTQDGRQDQAPKVDCSVHVAAARSTSGEWRIPLDPFVDGWSAGAPPGVALQPGPVTPSDSWQVGFATAATAVQLPAARAAPAAPPVPPSASGASSPGSAGAAAGSPPETAPLLPPPGPTATCGTGACAGAPSASPPSLATPGRASVIPTGAIGGGRHLAVAALLALLLTGAVVALAAVVELRRARSPVVAAGWSVPLKPLGVLVAVAVLAGLAVTSEVTLYKIGLIIIVVVAAIGLHLLVNWTGELSLAHAALVGVPAFVVGKVAADHGISPVYLLPLGILTGAALGLVVGLPALRAKGLQVALVTLAVAVAADQYLFTQQWLVGPPEGLEMPAARLGPVELQSERSLYALLVVCALAAVAAAWLIYRSKLGRGMLWLRAVPNGAAAFGVPVASYKLLAYSLAGAFAGFGGGLTVVWVQRLTPGAFPLQLSFTYLLIVVLAGRGFLGGVVAAAALIEGGTVFASSTGTVIGYAGPVALIVVLTRFRSGFNGIGVAIMQRLRSPGGGEGTNRQDGPATARGGPTFVIGVVAIAVGFAAIGLAWYHAGGTNQLWVQNQGIVSGGLGGLGLIIVGTGLLIRDRMAANQALLIEQLGRLLAARSVEGAVDEPPADPTAPAEPSGGLLWEAVNDQPANGGRRQVVAERR